MYKLYSQLLSTYMANTVRYHLISKYAFNIYITMNCAEYD